MEVCLVCAFNSTPLEYDRETLYDLDGDDAYDYVRPVSAEPYEDYYRSIGRIITENF